MSTLAGVVRAREAIEDGDVRFAAEILYDLEEDLAGALFCSTAVEQFRCPDCGATFAWPGELADHRDRVHWQAAA